ncbi:MAG: hypothetical protein WBC04_08295 [Candidatus Acidiferrales bacterium]
MAPEGFGAFSHHLLVGNSGNGRINPLTVNGLWALQFGNGAKNNGSRRKLFFTAGIADQKHGLFGFIKAGREDGEEDEN